MLMSATSEMPTLRSKRFITFKLDLVRHEKN